VPTAAKQAAARPASVISAGNGQLNPALNVNRPVDGATCTRRALIEPNPGGSQTKHVAHSAHCPLCWHPLPMQKPKERTLIGPAEASSNRGRYPGMVGEIISERRATSNRNTERLQRGFVSDIPRNPHPDVAMVTAKFVTSRRFFIGRAEPLTSGIDCPTSGRQTTTGACLQRVGKGGRPKSCHIGTFPAQTPIENSEKEFRV